MSALHDFASSIIEYNHEYILYVKHQKKWRDVLEYKKNSRFGTLHDLVDLPKQGKDFFCKLLGNCIHIIHCFQSFIGGNRISCNEK